MKAIIIGGGIAGCSAAYSLAMRGTEVTLLEKGDVASAASGNPLGILHPRLEKQWNPVTRFYLSAFYYAVQMLERAGGKGVWWDSPGMLQFPKRRNPQKSEARLAALPAELGLPEEVARYVEAEEAGCIAGIDAPCGALYMPQGAWVEPKQWCRKLLSHPHIQSLTNSTAHLIEKTVSGWRVQMKDSVLDADILVVASAIDALHVLPHYALPISTSRGQLSFLPQDQASAPIKAIICYDGYLSPARDGMHICGSTYDYQRRDLEVDEAGHRHNLSMLQRLWPDLFIGIDISALKGRAALRTVTPDRLPLVGQLQEGLYLSVGHGSRGLLSAPLAGELITSLVYKEPFPCDGDVVATLSPLRFGAKAL